MAHSRPGPGPGEQTPVDDPYPPAQGQNTSTLPETSTTGKGALTPAGDLAYRRPHPPFPIEPYDLPHPAVPPALDGLTILHISDVHVRRTRPLPDSTRRAVRALEATHADLAIFTGDYMNHPGDEDAAMISLRALVGACRARRGVYGIFGNHDTWELRSRARHIPGITWLSADCPFAYPHPGLRLLGVDEPEDLLSALVADRIAQPPAPSAPDLAPRDETFEPLTAALVHYPSEILVGADFNIPVMFAGHTHGGQFRITSRLAPHTSCDLPADRASGILRIRQTLCAVSRGLGNAVVELRLNCPAQIPLYTLRRAALPALGPEVHEQVTLHRAW